MSIKIEFTPFTPEENSILDEGGVVTRFIATMKKWAAYRVPKEVGNHACMILYGDTEEKARQAASPENDTVWPGIRADGPHFY